MLIYKATSQTTGKIYIGQTSQTLQERINQHNSHAYGHQSNYHFHNAIKKYGVNDFIYEVIEDNIESEDILNEREKYWINYYDSYYNGYNSTLGGDGKVTRDDKLIKKLFLEGKTTREICQITGYNKSTVIKSYKIQNLTEENLKRVHNNTKLRCSFPVEQYDLKGNFIKLWPSATECGKFFGNQTAISAVCRQDEHSLSAYGYLFKYSEDSRSIEEWVNRYNNKRSGGKPKKQVGQYDLNWQLIKIYESGADAARAMGKSDKSRLCSAARNGNKAYGYYWKYIEKEK